MTNQTWIEIGTTGGSTIRDLAPVIGPSITALATLVTGLFVVWYARRQANIAKDKLALDLFDRRLKAWEAMSAAIVGCFDECFAVWTAGPNGPYAEDQLDLSATKAAWNQAHWLFGDEVILKFAFIESELRKMRLKLFTRWEIDEDFQSRENSYKVLRGPALLAFNELQKLVEPYMMLGHIAVNKPSRNVRTR